MPTQKASLAILAVGLFGLSACIEREVARVDPAQSAEQVKEIDVFINRDIDILFVIDNSNSMSEEQESLATNFERFVNVLNTIDGGLPNVHIGVVSTDLGAGPHQINRCTGNGHNGVLHQPTGCSGPSDRWIEDVATEDDARRTNYPGTLAETFSCLAQIGDLGCGFEQPLEAMFRALNGSNTENAGFLRPDAKLAVIIISDEDDCSVENVDMFDSNPALNNASSELGFLSSFRCFEFGVKCEPDTPRSIGPRQNCVPREDSDYMYSIGKYVNFIRSLKDDADDIFVAGIIGNPRDVVVGLEDGEPTLQPSCSTAAGEAEPGIRLSAFLDAFPNRSTTTTICNENLSDAITQIAVELRDSFGFPCLDGDLKLIDGEPDCTVADIYDRNKDTHEETLIARCDASMSNLPCYHYVEDTEECNLEQHVTQLQLIVERGDAQPRSGTEVVAHCQLN